MTSERQLADIERRHRVEPEASPDVCIEDAQSWPCDARVLADEVRRQDAEAEIEAYLLEGWAIWPHIEDAEWSIGKIDEDFECGGYSVSWLASGQTPAKAIAAARARIEQDEREAAERRADYAWRKAAGQLSPLEIVGEYTAAMFTEQVLRMAEINTVAARLITRGFERTDSTAAGDDIKINTWELKA